MGKVFFVNKMKEFINCANCGKIVNARSLRCHKCGSAIGHSAEKLDESDSELNSQSHAEGGYDAEADDWDYEDFVRSEFGSQSPARRSVWYYVTWLMVAVLLLPFLLSLLQ